MRLNTDRIERSMLRCIYVGWLRSVDDGNKHGTRCTNFYWVVPIDFGRPRWRHLQTRHRCYSARSHCGYMRGHKYSHHCHNRAVLNTPTPVQARIPHCRTASSAMADVVY